MATSEDRHEANRQLVCLWALSRAGPGFGDNVPIVVGTTELGDCDAIPVAEIKITAIITTPEGRKIHVSSDQYRFIRWELHPRELYERDREQLLESATAA